MKKYTLTLNPSFMMDAKKPRAHDFNSPAELYEFLVETLGYDDDIEIKRLIEVGGYYYEPTIRERKDFGADPKKDSDFEIIVRDIEKTPFNDVDLFRKEYRSYLIGKKINVGVKNQITETIQDVQVSAATIKDVFIETENDSIMLNVKDFQSFIDGKELITNYEKNGNYNDETKIQLILQNDNENESFNENDFKYYLISTASGKARIVQGFEYKEDAKEELAKLMSFGGNVKFNVVSKKELSSVNIDPSNNDAWQRDTRDYSIVETALKRAVERGDFNEKRSNEILELYREQKLITVIKAQLLYLHEELQHQLHRAFRNSDVDRINESHALITRIESELRNIIKSE